MRASLRLAFCASLGLSFVSCVQARQHYPLHSGLEGATTLVGSVSVARYIGGMLIHSARDGQDVGLPALAESRGGEAER